MHNNCMNRLSTSERARIIAALVEGNSLRSTSRLCDVAFNAVSKLVPQIGVDCGTTATRVFVMCRAPHRRVFVSGVESLP